MQHETPIAVYWTANMYWVVTSKARRSDIELFIKITEPEAVCLLIDHESHCRLRIMLAHHNHRPFAPGVIHMRAGNQQLALKRIYTVSRVTFNGKIRV